MFHKKKVTMINTDSNTVISMNLYTFMNVLRNCTLKFWLLIDKLKVYGIRFTTFGSGGGRYFRGGSLFSAGLLLSGGGRYFRTLLAATKKLTLISGGRYYGNFTVVWKWTIRYGLFYSPILFAFVSNVLKLF